MPVDGRLLRRRRVEAGWTQVDLAREAGVHPRTISRIERGETAASAGVEARIEHALRARERR